MSYRYKKRKYYNKKSYSNEMENYGIILMFILVIGIGSKIIELYKTNPILFILGSIIIIAIISYVLLYFRKKKNDKLMNIKTIDDMKKLDWREFEKFIEFIFKKKGYKAKTRKGRNDGGIDVDATYNGQKYVIQCKKWDKYKIGVVQLREFYGVVKMSGNNTKGIYITTSSLTKEALKEYETIKNDVELWDNSNLEGYVEEFKGININKENNIEKKEKVVSKTIKCERCGGNMILREAHKGEHKGEEFYGCDNFPKCRNIIKIKN